MHSASILGALLAGGQSRRFGRDKAQALLNGQYLIDHIIHGLSKEVDDLVICGRSWRTIYTINDRIGPQQGPLAGLEAALYHARQRGYSHLATAPVDVMPFPAGIIRHLVGPQPAVLADQFLIAVWPTSLADRLRRHMDAGERSFHSWITHCGARRLTYPGQRININRPDDWQHLMQIA
ncbi:molybdenum cofactor guanylyltransferase [Sphingopyxis sp. MWB1]|uniref:molybdenum cofactor guanylyltransferase n=1 Tax=Sphingopyxis sp. MWB1 TaxID=1537715 RepID=UPI00051A16D2|nr:molybdenum cofactor guanylyltransferase [Sphingopyxis sp. MWB1]